MEQSGSKAVTILYVDADLEAADSVARALEAERERFHVETATSPTDGLAHLDDADDGIDCIVSAYELPEQDGVEFLTSVRGEYPELPFILYPTAGDEQVASEAISADVTEYLSADSGRQDSTELAARIERVVEQYPGESPSDSEDETLGSSSIQHGWYETLLETLPVGILVLDAEANIEWVNEPFWSAIDKTEAEVTGRRFLELVEEGIVEKEIATKYWDLVEKLRSPESETERGTIEFTVDPPHEDGRREYVGYIGLKPSDEGEFSGTVNAFRDVTDRRKRERRLEQYKAAMETVPDGMFLLDGAGTIIRVNEAWASTVGYEPDELHGEPFTKLVEEDVIDQAVVERYRKLIGELLEAGGENQQIEFRTQVIPPDDDQPHTYEVHAGLLPYDEAFQGTAATVRDITDRIERQRRLERENERLEKFASVVSHDLRNPINVASGSIDAAEQTGDTEHFDRARRAIDRMDRLVDDLLTLARQGDQIEAKESVDLNAIVETCWETVETNGATLSVATDTTIQADPGRLRQLLENLFRNAVEHGGDAVSITVGELDDSAGFYVEDDGKGIPESERDRIFESGYSTATDETGFGLSIVSEIVDAHDWTIKVTEGDSGGARFEIHTDGGG
ncbi:MAG: PAS domain S-box protein [Halobacteriales archaeon]